jgi:hypothetical protein
MASEIYEGRQIQVISFDDVTSDEYVIEFVDPAVSPTDSLVAVFSADADWSSARVSINPDVDAVSAEFLVWALKIARGMMDNNGA